MKKFSKLHLCLFLPNHYSSVNQQRQAFQPLSQSLFGMKKNIEKNFRDLLK
jgi:hypothetical protein